MRQYNKKQIDCPACGCILRQPLVHNALSRYAPAYICSGCGNKEAFEGFFWRSNAIALGLHDIPANGTHSL